MKKGNVVIWHIGRCGSTVLSNILNQHPEIECLGEVLNPLMKAKSSGEEIPDFDTTFSNLQKHDQDKIQILEVKFLESQHLSVYNLTLQDLIHKFIEIGYDKFIILERKNYLKRMVSHCVAQETKIYHLEKDKIPKLHRIYFDIENIKVGITNKSLINWFRTFKSNYCQLREYLTNQNYLELGFEEDIQSDVKNAYDKVCSFLNIENADFNISYTRTNPFSTKEVLININEVEKTLNDSEFSWMLKS